MPEASGTGELQPVVLMRVLLLTEMVVPLTKQTYTGRLMLTKVFSAIGDVNLNTVNNVGMQSKFQHTESAIYISESSFVQISENNILFPSGSSQDGISLIFAQNFCCQRLYWSGFASWHDLDGKFWIHIRCFFFSDFNFSANCCP